MLFFSLFQITNQIYFLAFLGYDSLDDFAQDVGVAAHLLEPLFQDWGQTSARELRIPSLRPRAVSRSRCSYPRDLEWGGRNHSTCDLTCCDTVPMASSHICFLSVTKDLIYNL